MPAGASAASLSSSSRQARQRKMQAACAPKGNGRGSGRRGNELSRSSSDRRGSQRNLMGSMRSVEGSSRSMEGSQRNLMRPGPNMYEGRSESRLAESMPTLFEGREKLVDSLRLSQLDDSVRTNPELFLTTRESDEGTFDVELRRRASPQNEEQGAPRPQTIRQQGEAKNNATQKNHSKKNHPPALKTKDTFNDNDNNMESTNPRDGNWLPSWCDPFVYLRLLSGQIVNDIWVQNIVLLLIVINAIMMGVATFPFVKENPDVLTKFELCDQIFLILFTIESAMQLIYWGWNLFKDGFLVFDLLIVVMSWALEGTQVFRAFRIFRAMRLITRISTLKNLVLALFSVVPKMTAIFMLLLLIFYIFGVMFTQLYKDLYERGLVEEPYFSTIYNAFFTLFQMMTLDEWAEIMYQIMETHAWAWAPFVIYVIITGFVVVNLIIAVICDAVHVLGNEGKSGLHGSDESQAYLSGDAYQGGLNTANSVNATEQKLEELQNQLNEMGDVQEQMRLTIGILVAQLRENAARDAASISMHSIGIDSLEEIPAGQHPRSRTMPDDSRYRTSSIPNTSEICSRTL